MHLDQGRQRDVVIGGGYDSGSRCRQGQLIPYVGVGGVRGQCVIRLNVKAIDVPTIGVSLVQDGGGVSLVENVRGIRAMRHGFSHDPLCRNDEVIGHGAGQIIVLAIVDGPPESDFHLHEVGPIVG